MTVLVPSVTTMEVDLVLGVCPEGRSEEMGSGGSGVVVRGLSSVVPEKFIGSLM